MHGHVGNSHAFHGQDQAQHLHCQWLRPHQQRPRQPKSRRHRRSLAEPDGLGAAFDSSRSAPPADSQHLSISDENISRARITRFPRHRVRVASFTLHVSRRASQWRPRMKTDLQLCRGLWKRSIIEFDRASHEASGNGVVPAPASSARARSIRQVAREQGCSRTTIRRCLEAAEPRKRKARRASARFSTMCANTALGAGLGSLRRTAGKQRLTASRPPSVLRRRPCRSVRGWPRPRLVEAAAALGRRSARLPPRLISFQDAEVAHFRAP